MASLTRRIRLGCCATRLSCRSAPPDPPPQAANAVLASAAARGASGGMGCVLDAVQRQRSLPWVRSPLLPLPPVRAKAPRGYLSCCEQPWKCARKCKKHRRFLLPRFVSNRYGRYRIAPIPMRCLGHCVAKRCLTVALRLQPGARVLHRRRPEPTVPALRGLRWPRGLFSTVTPSPQHVSHAFRVGGWGELN